MIVTLKTSNIPTLDQIRAFLDGSESFELHIPDRDQAYGFIAGTLKGLRCSRLRKPDKGLVRRYLIKVSGLSRRQLARLIAQYHRQGHLEDRRKKPPARPCVAINDPWDEFTAFRIQRETRRLYPHTALYAVEKWPMKRAA